MRQLLVSWRGSFRSTNSQGMCLLLLHGGLLVSLRTLMLRRERALALRRSSVLRCLAVSKCAGQCVL